MSAFQGRAQLIGRRPCPLEDSERLSLFSPYLSCISKAFLDPSAYRKFSDG
jgi:hypothetical protein